MAEPSILGALRDPQFRSDTLRNLVEALNGAKRSLTVGSLGAAGDMGNTLANLVRAGAGTAYHEATGRPIPQALEYRDPARDFGTSASLGNFAEQQGWLPPQTYSMPEQAGALLGPIVAMKAPDLAQSTLRGLVSALKSEPSRRMVEGLVDGMGARPQAVYHRYTQGGPDNGAGYMMYADDPAKVENGYGRNHWTVDDAKLPPGSVIDADSPEFQKLARRALVRDHETTKQYWNGQRSFRDLVRDLVGDAAPRDIVNSAGLWDAPDLVDSVYRHGLDPSMLSAVRTPDGLISFDPAHAVRPAEASRPRQMQVRPAKERLSDVADSNFDIGIPQGDKTVDINSLVGRMSSAADDAQKVDALAKQMASDGGYIERLIVDQFGNVIEGQHRLNALRKLGVKDVPVSVINDYSSTFEMLTKSGMRPEHARNVVQYSAEMLKDSGTAAKVLEEYELPKGYEDKFRAALKHMSEQ